MAHIVEHLAKFEHTSYRTLRWNSGLSPFHHIYVEDNLHAWSKSERKTELAVRVLTIKYFQRYKSKNWDPTAVESIFKFYGTSNKWRVAEQCCSKRHADKSATGWKDFEGIKHRVLEASDWGEYGCMSWIFSGVGSEYFCSHAISKDYCSLSSQTSMIFWSNVKEAMVFDHRTLVSLLCCLSLVSDEKDRFTSMFSLSHMRFPLI